MKKIFLISIIIGGFISCNTTKTFLIRQVEKKALQNQPADSILNSIQKNNDLVVGYSLYNNTWLHVPNTYFLIGYKKNKASYYFFQRKRNGVNNEPSVTLKKGEVTRTLGDSVLRLLKNIKGWNIQFDDVTVDTPHCPHIPGAICKISDSSANDFFLITNTHSKVSRFYAPEYFENKCCPGNEERKKFLSIKGAIMKVFSGIL